MKNKKNSFCFKSGSKTISLPAIGERSSASVYLFQLTRLQDLGIYIVVFFFLLVKYLPALHCPIFVRAVTRRIIKK